MKLRSKLFGFLIIIVMAIILCAVFVINHYKNKVDDIEVQEFDVETFPIVEDTTASINKYYIYGRSLNVEGTLNIALNESDIKDISLVMQNKRSTLPLKTSYVIEKDRVIFKTSDLLNDGIILDDLEVGNFFLLMGITYNDSEGPRYYTFKNDTNYENLDYYTITNNDENRYITIDFISTNNKPSVAINVVNEKLPDNVYDIVIDPGHGGPDPGATYKNREEALLNLAVSKMIKEELEELGLKVKLTRDNDTNPGGRSGSDQYGPGGRVSIPFEAKAKYLFSIHVNFDEGDNKSGLEMYMPNMAKFDLARSLISNITDSTPIRTSSYALYRKEDGIYVRTLSSEDIALIKKDAQSHNFDMYNIKQGTPYYFIIRETGGIATSAYVDGRNPKYSKNEYYNSNIGIETYILELGYINNNNDYKIIINNEAGYAKGISKAIKDYIFK